MVNIAYIIDVVKKLQHYRGILKIIVVNCTVKIIMCEKNQLSV